MAFGALEQGGLADPRTGLFRDDGDQAAIGAQLAEQRLERALADAIDQNQVERLVIRRPARQRPQRARRRRT